MFGGGTTYGRWRGEQAHRYSYRIMHGMIPEGKMICHTCDNPSCVNIKHLFLGTAKDNMFDMAKKQRCAKQKLPPEQVSEIRVSSADTSALAAMYDVSEGHIWRLRNGYHWQWL